MTSVSSDFDFVSQAFKRDPFPTYARLHAETPVFQAKMPMVGAVWMVAPHADVTTLLKDKARFVQEPQNAGRRRRAGVGWWAPRTLKALTDNMLGRDEPAHRRLRGLVDKAFSRRGVESLRGRIESIADRLLADMESATEVDLAAAFARPLPLTVICELLGLPEDDRPMFTRMVKAMIRSPTPIGMLATLPTLFRLSRYLRGQLALRRRQPKDDLITALVEVEEAGDQLDEEELLAMVFLLLIAGHETTVHLIAGGTLALLRHPDQLDRLRSDWSGIVTAVEELLRYCTPVEFSTVRYASEDVALHGRELPRGAYIVAALAAANADPHAFPDPARLDLAREPNPHVAFGTGVHFCLGLQLARLEAQIAVERLFRRFPDMALAVEPDDIEWLGTLGMRGVRALPVKLGAPARAV